MKYMLSVKGVFDGEVVRPLEKLSFRNSRNVIITFVDDSNDEEMNEIQEMSLNPSGFDFWNDEEEDLYGEYLNEK
jgi:hypothetical protein